MKKVKNTEEKSDKTKSAYKINKVSQGRFMVASAAAGTSGDAACACSLPDGRLAFILSDGMGSGMNAAAESQAVVTMLRGLLKKGLSPARAIKVVNKGLLEDRSKEMFATIDLIIVDKVSGMASIYKMGAATSFLLREGQVKKLERAALPVGMLRSVKTSQMKLKLKPGDAMIMVSDGVTDADRRDLSAKWLQQYLKCLPQDIGPRVLAGEIVSLAQQRYLNREKDDLTALVIRVS